eukprot:jgi/Astpho2/2411/Aster-x1075
MLVVVSPAKTIAETPAGESRTSDPVFAERTAQLVKILQKLSHGELRSLMGVSAAIAKLNAERYASWDEQPAKQAILAFDGQAFKGLDVHTLSSDDLEAAQGRLRVLSGLYGVLKPFDLMRPYRLEMGTKLENAAGKDLYAFWGSQITDSLRQELDQQPADTRFLVNCASQEYFKSVKLQNLGHPVYTMHFPGSKGAWTYCEEDSTGTKFVFHRSSKDKPSKSTAKSAAKRKDASTTVKQHKGAGTAAVSPKAGRKRKGAKK